MDHGGGKIGDKISWDTLPQTTFLTICQIKKGKLSFPSPTPSMQCCATVWATCRKQSTPRLWMEGGGGGEGLYCYPKLPQLKTIEWLSFTLASNEKRRFVPRDQVSPFTCRLLFIISTHKLVVSRNILSIWIALSSFYLFIFYFEKFLTWIWRLPFAV